MRAEEYLPIRVLDADDDVASFCSGNDDNDRWLRERAKKAMASNTARVYVLETVTRRIVGYYSLSAHSVRRSNELPGSLRRNVPDPIPCTLLGQLAVDQSLQGVGAGARLLQDAVKRALLASGVVASRALVVDAADENAAGFYRHFGFKPLSEGRRLFIPLNVKRSS